MLVDELWKNATEVFYRKGDIELVLPKIQKFCAVDLEYRRALELGGMQAFSNALRVFGITDDKNAKNILWWNDPVTWIQKYKEFFTDVWSFAEDVFGNQFMFDKSGVVWLQIETGELKHLCHTFSEWIALIYEETDFYTGASVAATWQRVHPDEPLTGLYHLSPMTLFICGGDYDPENLFRFEAKEHMVVKANIARQIKDLPDGTKIEFKFED